jgi:hypothetical protein
LRRWDSDGESLSRDAAFITQQKTLESAVKKAKQTADLAAAGAATVKDRLGFLRKAVNSLKNRKKGYVFLFYGVALRSYNVRDLVHNYGLLAVAAARRAQLICPRSIVKL